MLVGCASNVKYKHDVDSLASIVKDGDLIFRRGTGVVGRIVTTTDREGLYSHVGIIVTIDNTHYVIHAVPHEHEYEGDYDRVKCENIAHFVHRYNDADIGIYRLDVSDSIKSIATQHAIRLSKKDVGFDHNYNLEDTTTLYCTEFVEYVYGFANISISEGRRSNVKIATSSDLYIMPSDLTNCSRLSLVYN